MIKLNKGRFAADLAIVLGLTAAGHLLIAQGGPPALVVAGQLLCGFLMVGSYVAAHELVHHRLFHSRWMDNLLGVMLLLPTLSNFFAYRRGHMVHHRYSATQRDPAYLRHSEFPAWLRLLAYVFHYLHLTYALIIPIELYEAYQCLRRRSTEGCVPYSALFLAGLYIAIGYELWLAHVLFPYLAFCLFQTIKNSAEHDYLYKEQEGGRADQLATTRSIATTALVRRFWFNCMLHKEHHFSPSVPYHALETLTDRCDDAFDQRIGYFAFCLLRWNKGPPEPMFI